jgi:hypothetical protein
VRPPIGQALAKAASAIPVFLQQRDCLVGEHTVGPSALRDDLPGSHWDTDWKETYAGYFQRSDGNILAAVPMEKTWPRFRCGVLG